MEFLIDVEIVRSNCRKPLSNDVLCNIQQKSKLEKVSDKPTTCDNPGGSKSHRVYEILWVIGKTWGVWILSCRSAWLSVFSPRFSTLWLLGRGCRFTVVAFTLTFIQRQDVTKATLISRAPLILNF
jgi:hypothetical protein